MLLRQLLMPLLAATVLADYAVLENWSEFCEFGFDCEIPGITCHGDVKIPISCEIACNETPECVGYEVMDFFCLLYSEVPSKGVAEDACHQNSRTFVKTFSDYTQLTDWNELCARGDGACDASGLTCSDQPSEDDCRASCDENEGCAAWSYFNDFCATASYYPEAINSELADCHSGATWFLKNSFQDPKSAFSQHNVNAFCELGSNCEAAGVHCFPDIASVYMCQEFAVEKEAGGYQIGQLDEKDICVVFNERPSSEAAECPEGRTYIRIPDPDEDFTQLAEWSEYCARGKAACENGATCSEQSHEPECRVQCLHDDSCRAWEYLSEMQLCVLFHYVPIKMPSDDSCHSESTVHVSVKQPQMDDMFVLTPEFSAFCLSFYDCGERGINCVDVSSSYDCRLLAGEENAQGYEISDGICVLFSFRPRLDPETTPSVCTTPDQETYINYRPTFPPAVPEPTTAPCDCKVISTCLFVNSNEQNLASKKARLISALDRASDIHKQCCVSFSLHTGVVHELNYSNISIGNGGLKLGDILLPDGTVPAKKVGDDTIIVNPATGKRVGNLEFSDILYAIQSQGKQLCPDVVTPRADACKRLRVFGFEDFANITKLGLGLRPGRAVIISFTQNTLGTTLAHEAGHNLGLRHTEEEPASAENADPNNVMHEESVSTGSPTRLSTYLSRATLSERQCTAERAKIEPLGLCHTTLAGRQCPNTTWDGIREDIRRLDEEHQRNLTAIDAAVAERSRQLNQNITDAKKKLEEVKEELKKAGAPNHHEYEKTKKQLQKLQEELLAHEKKIRGLVNDYADAYNGKPKDVPEEIRKALHYLHGCIKEGILKKLRKLKQKPYGKKHRYPYKRASPEHDDVIKKCIEKYAAKKSHNIPVDKAPAERKLTAGYRAIQEKIKLKEAKIDKYDKVMSGPTGDKHRAALKQLKKANEDKKKLPEFKEDLRLEQEAKRKAALARLIEDLKRRTHGVNSLDIEVLSSELSSL